MGADQKPRTGRRPGESTTREAIAEAARSQFAELGYDRATIRGIASDAGVDPALVVHFFGSKQRLFVAVMAPPFEPEEVIPRILAGRRSELGRRYAAFAVGQLEDPRSRQVVVGIVRAAASEPGAARMVREILIERVVGAVAEAVGSDDARLRAELVGSQIVGLVMARYVVGAEPLASLSPDDLIEAIAPTFQRYLTGPLDVPWRPSTRSRAAARP